MVSFSAPNYLSRQPIERTVRRLRPHLPATATVYDIGCGAKPYAHFFRQQKYVGIDTDPISKADIIYTDEEHIPLPEASADLILCTQTLQHARRPEQLVQEIRRLLKPGAVALVTVPFGIKLVAAPRAVGSETWRDDYWRFTKYGLRLLLANLTIVSLEETTGYAGTLLQLVNYFLASLHVGFIVTPLYVVNNGLGWLLDHAARQLARHWPAARPFYDHIYCSLTSNYVAVVRKP